MAAKINESPGARAAVVVIALVALGVAIFEGFHVFSGGSESQTADPKEVKADAQKQLDIIKKENIPPALKAEMIAHYQGTAQGSQTRSAGGGPPGAATVGH
jgi:hypothetical protein